MEIIRDFEEILTSRLQEKLNFLQVLLGPRQVGKTTSLKRILAGWQGPKLMVTADAITPPSSDWIIANWRRARALGENTLFVIDEIQKIPGWSEVTKILFDEDRPQKKLKIVFLGSASLSLQKGLAESLAGRFEVIQANHWSFQECQKAFGFDLEKFLRFGGYPAAAEVSSDSERWTNLVLHSIIEPVLSKDIQGMVSIRKPALFRQAFELAMRYPAQEISLQKLLGQLQDRGNVTTLQNYFDLFEGAFLLRTLHKYSKRPLKTRTSSPKILPLNTALINAYAGLERLDTDPDWRGRIFEAAIGAHLHTFKGKLYYWREKKAEVDYILELPNHLYAIEVKSGRKKSDRGLNEFIRQYKKAIPILVDYESGVQFLSSRDINTFVNKLRP